VVSKLSGDSLERCGCDEGIDDYAKMMTMSQRDRSRCNTSDRSRQQRNSWSDCDTISHRGNTHTHGAFDEVFTK